MNSLAKIVLISFGWLFIQVSSADTIWHCSRFKESPSTQALEIQKSNNFNIASVGATDDVISISVRDLIDVYSGKPVRVSGEPLSACFLVGENKMSADALTSLGLKPSIIQALARKSAIVQAQLYWVSDEEDMMRCITKHFPAVGYLSNPVSNEQIDSCF